MALDRVPPLPKERLRIDGRALRDLRGYVPLEVGQVVHLRIPPWFVDGHFTVLAVEPDGSTEFESVV